MNKILFFMAAVVLFSCNNETKQQTELPGEFKYTSYHLNNSRDSFGLSLNHYLQIAKDGNYRLLLRNDNGQAGYYYGFIGFENIAVLDDFIADSSILVTDTVSKTSGETIFRLDYATGKGEKEIKFSSATEPERVKTVRAKLDSIIASPGKKQSSHFNIDAYLKKIIAEDSVGSEK